MTKKTKSTPPNKLFQLNIEIEFSGPKKDMDQRFLDWILKKEVETMPEDFITVKVLKSTETELSKAYARCHVNSKKDAKEQTLKDKADKKADRAEKKITRTKRAAVRKKAKRKAKDS